MWGSPIWSTTLGALASVRRLAWVGPPQGFFSPNSQNIKGNIPVKGGLEAYRTAWVREVLDPELVLSDDSALLIFSFVKFLCITADDQL